MNNNSIQNVHSIANFASIPLGSQPITLNLTLNINNVDHNSNNNNNNANNVNNTNNNANSTSNNDNNTSNNSNNSNKRSILAFPGFVKLNGSADEVQQVIWTQLKKTKLEKVIKPIQRLPGRPKTVRTTIIIDDDNNNSNNNSSNNNNNNNNNNSSNNSKNYMHFDQKTQEIHWVQSGKHKKWIDNPVIIEMIHNTVVKHAYSFRTAVKDLQMGKFAHLFQYLHHSTVNCWYSKPNPNDQWQLRPEHIESINNKHSFINNQAGRLGIFANSPEIQRELIEMLQSHRECGIGLNSIIIEPLIHGYLRQIRFNPFINGTFTASRRWIRKWMQKTLNLSFRKATKAAQKAPKDATEQIELMAARIAKLVVEFNIPKELLVNCDQTALHLIPKINYTYELKGSQNVSVVGTEDKRQITAVVACSLSGEILPFQLIYKGTEGKEGCFPRIDITKRLQSHGFNFQQTDSHWSTLETTKEYIETIIKVYFDEKIAKLNLKHDQKCILLVDVWHRDIKFIEYMRSNHPHIYLVYVPAGCTGLAQPCDVVLQRPLKHSILKQYCAWAAADVQKQLETGKLAKDVRLDVTLGNLRDRGALWALNSLLELRSNVKFKKVMLDGWDKCTIKRCYDRIFQLEAQIKYFPAIDLATVFVPFNLGKKKKEKKENTKKPQKKGRKKPNNNDNNDSSNSNANNSNEQDEKWPDAEGKSHSDSVDDDELLETDQVAENQLHEVHFPEGLTDEEYAVNMSLV